MGSSDGVDIEDYALSQGVGGIKSRGTEVAESVYKIVELVGTSSESWEAAAAAAVGRASTTLRDLRIAEVVQLDMQIEGGAVLLYRAKIKLSFKYEDKV